MSSRPSRPKPPSFRQNTIRRPSGDQAYDRSPGPHDGPPCSACSSRSGRGSAPPELAVQRLSQPPASQRKDKRDPSGANLGWLTAAPNASGTSAAAAAAADTGTETGTGTGFPVPSAGATTIRLSSH